MKIGKSVFLPNTIFRFCFSFYIADPISVKLRNRAVSRTNVTLSGVNRSYRTFYAPSLLRTPLASASVLSKSWGEEKCPLPLQSEAECENVIDMKVIFYSHANKTRFQKKGFALASF